MLADEDLNSENDFDESSQSTRFIPQEGDENALWKVVAITAENKKNYKVRWEGVDPDTGKPWAQSWVPKHDCTDDLVAEWKRKKRESATGKRKSASASKAPSSTRATSRTTTVSSSSSSRQKTSVSATAHTLPDRSDEPSTSRTRSSKTRPAGEKRGRIHEDSSDDPLSAPRELKRAKLKVKESDRVLKEGLAKRSRKVSRPALVDEDEVDFDRIPSPPKTKWRAKGTRMKKIGPLEVSADDMDIIEIGPSGDDRKSSSPDLSRTTSRLKNHSVGTKPAPKSKFKTDGRRAPTDEPQSDLEVDTGKGRKEKQKALARLRPSNLNTDDDDNHVNVVDKVRPRPRTVAVRAKGRLPLSDASDPEDDLPPAGAVQPPDDDDDKPKGRRRIQKLSFLRPPSPSPPSGNAPSSKPKAKDPVNTKNPKTALPNDSYITSIVPETETESSTNTQSQSLSHPVVPPSAPLPSDGDILVPATQSMDSSPHPPPPRKRHEVPSSPSHHSQSSPIKYPSAPNAAVPTHKKPLGPIPVLSPSVFRPLLTSSIDPDISRIESEMDLPQSPIEYFASPKKEEIVKKRDQRSYEDADDIETDSVVRGRELAEQARQTRLRENGQLPAKKPLGEIRVPRFENEDNSAERSPDTGTPAGTNGWQHAVPDFESGIEDLSQFDSFSVPPTFSGDMVDETVSGSDPVQRAEEPSLTQEFEKYVDLDGGSGGGGSAEDAMAGPEGLLPAHLRLREEEEESTQDVMMDMTRRDEVGPPVELRVDNPVKDIVMDSESAIEASDGALDNHVHEIASSRPPDGSEDSSIDPLSRLEAQSTTPAKQPGAADSQRSIASPTEDPSNPQTVEHLWSPRLPLFPTQARSGDANEQSEPVSSLEKAFAADSRAEKSQSAASTSHPSAADLQATFEVEKGSWDAERAALMSSIESLTRAKVSAEGDREFFRDQYARASGFVSSVRSENEALVQQVKVAERRADEGVRLVRETFALREKQLEGELKKYKDLSALLIERDKRTGDDIRRRAAEHPELKARCLTLERQVEQLIFTNQALEMDLAEWQNKRSDRESEEEDADAVFGKTGEREDEMVHRCQWRTDGTTVCESFFPNVEELRNHLFIARHLTN